ncbi:interferon alpha/beta receptor 2 [Sorex araneus]|uniref:interferon alpha/beta receptor 2 n=1 Tax=Sorex araneus TaxID=42254 RepID=UPI0024337419|nr:interferon alpha/beta receptor 2 [Sorex araneus]
MLWNPTTSALRPFPWSLLGLVSLLLRIAWVLPESSEKACTFKMNLRDFRLILSWEFKGHELAPTHYTLWYTIMSKKKTMTLVEDCAHITRAFCDLTDVWRVMGETYIPMVSRFHGNRTLDSCMGDIWLTTNMVLESPKFEIVGFTDHLKVTIHIPLGVSGIVEDLLFSAPLVIEEWSEMVVKKHKPKVSGNMTGDFSYVIDKLIPNTNHCVSVYFGHKNPDVIPAIKCTLLPAENPESSVYGKIGVLGFSALMLSAIFSVLTIMRRTGYICLSNESPKVLKFINKSAYVFLELSPLEKIDLVEVILVNKKRKVEHNNVDDDHNDDESDSQDEAAAGTSPGGYTMHDLGRLLSLASSSSSRTADGPEYRGSEEADSVAPEADREPLEVAGPGPLQRASAASEGSQDLPPGSFAEEDVSSTEGSGGRMLFNVDLNSVCVRSLEDEDSGQSLMLQIPGGTVDLEGPDGTDSGPVEASIAGAWLPSAEGLWLDTAPSEESDSSSESNFSFGDGYIAR